MNPRHDMGIILNGLPLPLLREYARRADAAGCHSIWFPEISFTDGFTPLALAAVDTARAQLGTGVVGIWSRSPTVMALTAATLAELSGGRVVLGLGTQARPYVSAWHGREYQRPLRAMREYVTIVRRVLAGENVTLDGEIFSVRNFRLAFPPSTRVPVYIAAVGPQMIELAGEIADGVIGAFWSEAYVREVVRPRLAAGAARAGRSPTEIAVTLNLPTLVGDGPAVFAQHRGMVLQFATADASSPAYGDSVRAAGFGAPLERLRAAAAAHDWDAAFSAIPPEMVDALTLTGSTAHVRERVVGYRAAGVDAVMAMPSQPGMFYPFYEGHLDGAPFPAFDFTTFTGSIESALAAMGG